MAYMDKYRTSKEWANLAYEEKEYNIAINRYYYSLFQKILYELGTKSVNVSYNKHQDSHNRTSALYVENFIDGVGKKDAFKIKTKFNSDFTQLKSLRHIADYQDRHITLKEAQGGKRAYMDLDNIV